MLLIIRFDHILHTELYLIRMFPNCVEMKHRDMSIMFWAVNSGDVGLLELGIGHALPMSLEAPSSMQSFCKTD